MIDQLLSQLAVAAWAVTAPFILSLLAISLRRLQTYMDRDALTRAVARGAGIAYANAATNGGINMVSTYPLDPLVAAGVSYIQRVMPETLARAYNRGDTNHTNLQLMMKAQIGTLMAADPSMSAVRK